MVDYMQGNKRRVNLKKYIMGIRSRTRILTLEFLVVSLGLSCHFRYLVTAEISAVSVLSYSNDETPLKNEFDEHRAIVGPISFSISLSL